MRLRRRWREGDRPRGTRPAKHAPDAAPAWSVSSGLDRVRQVARKDKDARFTALLHHVTVDRLRLAYRAIRPDAAPGVDGVTWRDYGQDLEENLRDLHARVHRGAYRARPSRRAYIPKADGRQRPLGIAALEDKIVQRAVVEVLNAIYEADFLGFSYGFRPGRTPHDALDALAVGITQGEGELGARRGHPRLLHQARSLVAGEVSRASDRGSEGPAPDPEMAQGRGHRGRGRGRRTTRERRKGRRFRRCFRTFTFTTSSTCGSTSGGVGRRAAR